MEIMAYAVWNMSTDEIRYFRFGSVAERFVDEENGIIDYPWTRYKEGDILK